MVQGRDEVDFPVVPSHGATSRPAAPRRLQSRRGAARVRSDPAARLPVVQAAGKGGDLDGRTGHDGRADAAAPRTVGTTAEGGAYYTHPGQWAKGWIKAGAPGHTVALVYVLADGFDRDKQRVRTDVADQRELAARTGKSERSVRNDLATLERLGAIDRSHRYRKRGSEERRRGTRYADRIVLLPDPAAIARMTSGSSVDYRKPASATTGSPLPDNYSPPVSPPGSDPCGSSAAGAATSETAPATGGEAIASVGDLEREADEAYVIAHGADLPSRERLASWVSAWVEWERPELVEFADVLVDALAARLGLEPVESPVVGGDPGDVLGAGAVDVEGGAVEPPAEGGDDAEAGEAERAVSGPPAGAAGSSIGDHEQRLYAEGPTVPSSAVYGPE
jgi:hypothetical protein